MKKQNKTKKEQEKEEKKEPVEKSVILHRDVKKSIWAVILMVFALVFILSLIGKAGIAGQHLDNFLALGFGKGRYVLPFLMIIVGVAYFRKLETVNYYLTSIGATVLFVFILGLIHSFGPLDEMAQLAKEGSGGGYLGLAVAFPLIKYLGRVAGIIISVGCLLIGLMLTFNFPLNRFVHWVKKMFDKMKQVEIGGAVEDANINQEEITEIKSSPIEDNIKVDTIEYVEDPNKEDETEKVSRIVMATEDENKYSPEKERKAFQKKSNWHFPLIDLLDKNGIKSQPSDLERKADIIKKTLHDFGIEVEKSGFNFGPTVVQYKFRPAAGVKLSKIIALQTNLALALAAQSIRIEAPIPGQSLVGVEVPLLLKDRSMVRMSSVLQKDVFKKRPSNLCIALGEDVNGDLILGNIEKMPHLMIAGSTGTGKSVCINSVLTALLYQNSPEQLRLILVDPKRVELSIYNGIPHLLTPVIVENSRVAASLKWAIREMEKRYKILEEIGVRDIHSFNEKVRKGKKRQVYDEEKGYGYEELKIMPFIVIVIDELADLMAAHGREVEAMIVGLAQKARAVGIHLIVSTQRPSVEVLTGLIKANITTRIAFQVATQVDSRTILDMAGAEKLLGNGDMLYLSSDSAKPRRVQGVFVSEKEVRNVVRDIKHKNQQDDWEEYDDLGKDLKENLENAQITSYGSGGEGGDKDQELFERAKEVVIESRKASTSFLQRRMGLGYSRAARVMDMLEQQGVVGPQEGSKPREILIGPATANTAYEDDIKDQEKRDKWQA